MKRLIICEKNSQARAVAIGLGLGPKGRLPWSSDDWIVAAASGHLLENAEPEDYDPRYEEWSEENLPILPERFRWKPRNEGRQAEVLKELVELIRDPEVKEVVNACDAGREGELIFKLIYRHAGVDKPVRRAWFSSLTVGAIRRAFDELRDDAEMKGLEDAAFARTIGDWLVGINATRAASIRAGAERYNVVSLGRVQTPTLRILVEREGEIDAHDPTPFYRVRGALEGGPIPAGLAVPVGLVDEEGELRTFPDEAEGEAEARALEGAEATLKAYDVREDERRAPLPYDLATLQVEAARAFGWTAARTLRHAQRLYEQQWISYPRTDSRFLTWDLKGQIQDALGALGEVVPELAERGRELAGLAEAGELPARPFNPSLVRDHHAIIPTGKKKGAESLSDDQARLYEMIARRLVAAFLPPLREERHEARFEVEGRRIQARGRRVLEAGWREVEPDRRGADQWEADLEALEPLRDRDEGSGAGTVAKSRVEERHPLRPRAHNDGTLIRAMERAGEEEAGEKGKSEGDEAGDDGEPHIGIGTPATRSAIIERLIRARYAERDRAGIYATLRGRRLIQALDDLVVTSPRLTSAWEQRLAAIREGREERAVFEADLRDLTRTTVEEIFARSLDGLDAPPEGIGTCPRCGGTILGRDRVYGCDTWKSPEEPGCGWAVFRNTTRGRIGLREARIRIQNDRPHATGGKERLAPAQESGDGPPVFGMEPYDAASTEGEPLPPGDDDEVKAAWDEAVRGVVEVEGPVMVSRVLQVLDPRARAGGWSTGKAKKQVNRRSAALVRAGELLEVDDGRTPKGQQDKVLRLTDQPEVFLRTRGPRDLLEIPWREIREADRALRGDRPGAHRGADRGEDRVDGSGGNDAEGTGGSGSGPGAGASASDEARIAAVARAFQVPEEKLEGAYLEWIRGALGMA